MLKKYLVMLISILLCIGFIGCTSKTIEVSSKSIDAEENTKILSDKDTENIFKDYSELYEQYIEEIDEGISGKISKKIYANTKNLSKKIKELNLKDDYKYKQDDLVVAFDYLNKAMNSYNDYVYMQGHRRNSFDTSYRDCIDSYNNYLSKSQAYYSLFKD